MTKVEQHFRKVIQQKAGARYYKVDLHIHTPSSTDARGSTDAPGATKYNYPSRGVQRDVRNGYTRAREIAGEILDKLVTEGISIAAFTDHNSPGYVDNTDFSSRTWYEIIREVYEQRRAEDDNHPDILLLPGVEITTDRIHILGIFDDQDPYIVFKIASLLRSVDIRETEFGQVDGVFGTKSIWEVADAIDELGGICIPAHINARSSRSLLTQYQPPDMEIERLVQHRAIHVFGVVPSSTNWADDTSYRSILENKTFKQRSGARVSYHNWMVEKRKAVPQHLPALGYMMNSDAHSITKIGERYSWVKVDDLSFRSLAAALRNPYYRIAPDRRKPVSPVRFHVLGLSVQRGFADGLCLRFNEHFNCIVAPPRTGKTTLMRVIHDTFWGKRLGLRVRDELEGLINNVADGLWEEIKLQVLTTGGKPRTKLSEGAKQGLQAAFLEMRDLPWTIFVFFSQESDGHKVIYAAERECLQGIEGLDRKEDQFRYYRSDPQPLDLAGIDGIHFSEIDRRDFRKELAKPAFLFGRVGLGDEEQHFPDARSLLDRHLLRVMDNYDEMRTGLFRLCNDLEKAAGQSPPDTAAIAAQAQEVSELLERMYGLRVQFAERFNMSEQKHEFAQTLRLSFRKGLWQEVVAAIPKPDEVEDYVHNIRLYLHGQEYYDIPEIEFYQMQAKRGKSSLVKVSFSELTPVERSLMALRLLLNSTFQMAPVFIDCPEQWLNNDALVDFADMRRSRDDQLVFFTQNANLSVLGNAEQTIILDVVGDRTQAVAIGGLEEETVAAHIVRLLEGGDTAFQRKLLLYQTRLRDLGLKLELQRPEKRG